MEFPAEVQELLDRPLCAQISTVSPAGTPQASIVWFERRGAEIVMMSPVDAPKVRNLKANPRIDIIVVDPERQTDPGTPCYVRLTGTAELRPHEEGIEHRLSRRYGFPDGYPEHWGPVGDIYTIHVAVRRVSGRGPYRDGESWEADEAVNATS